MMADPLVSVVVPAYNSARFIAATLDSIIGQDLADREIIVADHASTDGTREIVERYRDVEGVTVLHTDAGGGAPRNFERVSRAARGKYLKLVPGDDVLKPGVLSRQAALLERHPEAVLTSCPREFIDSEGRTIFARRGLAGLRGRVSGAAAVRRTVRAGSNIFGEPGCALIRRQALEEHGYWLFDFPFAVDQATYIRLLLDGDFVADDAVGAAFRMSSSQWSVALTRSQVQQVRSMHAWVRAQRPDVVSRRDLLIGDGRAYLLAQARRASYALLRRRMR